MTSSISSNNSSNTTRHAYVSLNHRKPNKMNVIRESGDYYKYIMDVDDAKKEGKIGFETTTTYILSVY